MENNQFPEQEEEILLPEETPELPVTDTPEELPVIEELNFESPAVYSMDDDGDEGAFLIGEAPPTVALPIEVETAPEEPMEISVSEIPAAPAVSFMDRIPDVAEDYPEETQVEPEAEVFSPEEVDPALEILSDPEFSMPQNPPQADSSTVSDQEYRDHGKDASESQQEKKSAYQNRPTKKGRPKRKKGEGLFGIPNILATGVWLALIVAIGVTMGRMLWICAADVLAFGREDRQVTITVYESDTMDDIVDKLYAGGLIRYKSLFNLYADISDAEEDIKPGIYDLNTRYDYHALVNFMSPSSSRSVIELTIPEGYTCRQIFALLEENRVCTIQDIASYAADGALTDYWFLEDLERGHEYCLEGYLFPDTYQFYKNSTPREALEKMLDNFENRFTEEMMVQLENLNTNVTGGGFDINDVVIVASLIEKESAAPAESAKIAGVIYNRLYNWDYPALLNIDAAIIYAQGGDAETIDTSIDSPYNTYRNVGLTPTAIANPGLSSLQAALNPESHNYYYYLLNPATGMHQFSTTQGEHDALIAEFYN